MSLIQQLSSHVADLIAAGEVVQRPASVVRAFGKRHRHAGASADYRRAARCGAWGSSASANNRLRHRP